MAGDLKESLLTMFAFEINAAMDQKGHIICRLKTTGCYKSVKESIKYPHIHLLPGFIHLMFKEQSYQKPFI